MNEFTVQLVLFLPVKAFSSLFLLCPSEWRAFARMGEKCLLWTADPGEVGWTSPLGPQVPFPMFCSFLALGEQAGACDRREEGHVPSQSISVSTVHHFNSLWKQLSFISSQKKGNFDQENYKVTKLLTSPCLAFVLLYRHVYPSPRRRESRPVVLFTQRLLWESNENGNQWLQSKNPFLRMVRTWPNLQVLKST